MIVQTQTSKHRILTNLDDCNDTSACIGMSNMNPGKACALSGRIGGRTSVIFLGTWPRNHFDRSQNGETCYFVPYVARLSTTRGRNEPANFEG